MSCGQPLERACSRCGTHAPAEARFCMACGSSLGADADIARRPQKMSSGPAIPHESTPPQPTYFADGRYVVERMLGEGGKKRVYLAHDGVLDRDVAFALIKTEGLDAASRTRITREAQAMGRLGSHPHIVTVFDLGSHDDQPYMIPS